MQNKYNKDFQYDSCVSRGICSINPKNSALQTIIILYLKIFTKYLLEINKKKSIDKNIKNLILNIIATTVYNTNFNDSTFLSIIKTIKLELPKIIEIYKEFFKEKTFDDEQKLSALFEETININSAIKYGEKILKKNQKNLTTSISNIYNIILMIIKNLSINILQLESFNYNYNTGFNKILEILNEINLEQNNTKKLKEIIIEITNYNNEALKILREEQEKRYGKQEETIVSFTTTIGKAILVVGSNIRELENILEIFKNLNVDIYTHDEMMLAYTFPKFKEYPKLKGQYGQGLENCLLDFATFPGPIILTQQSLHNIENFYRGALYTTDPTITKGVINIKNNDFTKVINAINSTKGFKTGKICENINFGYSLNKILNKIDEKINKSNYKNIFLIGICNYFSENKEYFENLIKHTPDDTLIISLSYNIKKNNVIFINACFDSNCLIRIYEYIKNLKLPITIFFPKCNRDTISDIIYLASNNNNIYIDKCTPVLFNPSIINTLKELFPIKTISTVKKDLKNIL